MLYQAIINIFTVKQFNFKKSIIIPWMVRFLFSFSQYFIAQSEMW